ncbi:MAG: hypothetical protein WA364_12435 [Candidatus Nitrosopolaris sp.]
MSLPSPRTSNTNTKRYTSFNQNRLDVWQGYYEGIDGQHLKTTDRGVKYPLTPGHEIAGTVEFRRTG